MAVRLGCVVVDVGDVTLDFARAAAPAEAPSVSARVVLLDAGQKLAWGPDGCVSPPAALRRLPGENGDVRFCAAVGLEGIGASVEGEMTEAAVTTLARKSVCVELLLDGAVVATARMRLRDVLNTLDLTIRATVVCDVDAAAANVVGATVNVGLAVSDELHRAVLGGAFVSLLRGRTARHHLRQPSKSTSRLLSGAPADIGG
ncbi:hypothetical protein M885DRAFT_109236 [Pelagophyceae sp. CCMP2097]|nr:hypothetical protein M885DRAFT_109236 [Pelagophyceae sp. CCMP2097]